MIIEIEELDPELILELNDMLNQHKEELCSFDTELKPDWVEYSAAQKTGAFVAYIAREEGIAIGYAGFFLRNHLHYTDLKVANQDVFFLDPEYRGGSKGLRLLRFCEESLKDMGVSILFQHAKANTPFDKILPAIGYDHHENIYSRRLT